MCRVRKWISSQNISYFSDYWKSDLFVLTENIVWSIVGSIVGSIVAPVALASNCGNASNCGIGGGIDQRHWRWARITARFTVAWHPLTVTTFFSFVTYVARKSDHIQYSNAALSSVTQMFTVRQYFAIVKSPGYKWYQTNILQSSVIHRDTSIYFRDHNFYQIDILSEDKEILYIY